MKFIGIRIRSGDLVSRFITLIIFSSMLIFVFGGLHAYGEEPQLRKITGTKNLGIWHQSQNYQNEDPGYFLQPGDYILMNETSTSLPGFIATFYFVNKDTFEHTQDLYYLSAKIIQENSKVVNNSASPSTSLQKTFTTKRSSNASDDAGYSTDPSWTFKAADQFCLDADFSAPCEIHPNSEWGAGPIEPMNGKIVELVDPTSVVIHHAVTTKRTASEIQKIQRIHINGEYGEGPMVDIGYHYLIAFDDVDHQWKIYQGRKYAKDKQGRDVLAIGGHVKNPRKSKIPPKFVYPNKHSIAICIVGNYSPFISEHNDTGYDKDTPEYRAQPPEEALLLVGQLINFLKQEYPTLNDLYTHGADTCDEGFNLGLKLPVTQIVAKPKECPGKACVHLCGALRQRFFGDSKAPAMATK